MGVIIPCLASWLLVINQPEKAPDKNSKMPPRARRALFIVSLIIQENGPVSEGKFLFQESRKPRP